MEIVANFQYNDDSGIIVIAFWVEFGQNPDHYAKKAPKG